MVIRLSRPGLRAHAGGAHLAQELSQPHSLGFALDVSTMLHQLRREDQITQRQAEQMMAIASNHGFALELAWATIMRGWGLAKQGQAEGGITQLRQGLAAYRATGAETFVPYFFSLLAEAYEKAEQAEKGLEVLNEALIVVDKNGERYYEAELYRLKGELLLAQESKGQKSKGKRQKAKVTNPQSLTPDPQGEAEACFLKAIEIAQKQQAKSLELRAVMSLVRLRKQQATQPESRTTQHETRTRLDKAHQCYLRSTAGSLKGLIRKTCKRRRGYSKN